MPPLARKSLLLVTGLAVALVAAELVLRAIGFGVVTPEMSFGVNTRSALESGTFEPHPDLFWTLPETAGAFDRAVAAVHPERPVPPKSARRRVVVLGDSCSRLAVRGLPYSAYLQERLSASRAEVLNASVPGYTSHQGLAWLRTQLLELEPDVLVVYFGWNDHWRATGITDRAYAATLSSSRSRLLSLLDRRPSTPPLRVPLDAYRENLRAIVDEARDAGAHVVLVAAPFSFSPEARTHLVRNGSMLPGDEPAALHERYLEVVRSYVGEENVSVLSADLLFRGLDGPHALLHRDGIHPTDVAHAALGAALAAVIDEGIGADGTLHPDLLVRARVALSAAANPGTTP